MVVVIQNLDAKFWLKILINLFLWSCPNPSDTFGVLSRGGCELGS